MNITDLIYSLVIVCFILLITIVYLPLTPLYNQDKGNCQSILVANETIINVSCQIKQPSKILLPSLCYLMRLQFILVITLTKKNRKANMILIHASLKIAIYDIEDIRTP